MNKSTVLKGDENRAVKKWRKNKFVLSERWQEYGYARRGKWLLFRKETSAAPKEVGKKDFQEGKKEWLSKRKKRKAVE